VSYFLSALIFLFFWINFLIDWGAGGWFFDGFLFGCLGLENSMECLMGICYSAAVLGA
jgi:hypothetical protein